MIKFFCRDFFDHLEHLRSVGEVVLLDEIKQGASTKQLARGHVESVGRLVDELKDDCTRLQLTESANRIVQIQQCLLGFSPPCTYEVVARDLRILDQVILGELRQRCFVYIPTTRQQYFESDVLFGEPVKAAFPSMSADIKDAGNCYAADLHTAAVFHLMRVAEKGLRTLSRHLRVRRLKDKTPIDLAMWGQIIGRLNQRLVDLSKPNKTQKRVERLEFYGDLLSSLTGFKDLWRNAVSHDRKRFDEDDSAKAMKYVSDFMKRLATRVRE